MIRFTPRVPTVSDSSAYSGKAKKFNGLEMVWALEAFGAAYTLQALTSEIRRHAGRNEALNAIVKGKAIPRVHQSRLSADAEIAVTGVR